MIEAVISRERERKGGKKNIGWKKEAGQHGVCGGFPRRGV